MDHRRFYSVSNAYTITILTSQSNNRIHISDISQENWHGKAYVQGIVTLKWPYSISENTSRILLSEENLDKRRDKGQLIVVMHGHLAEEFVQKVKNNDRIAISREGAELQESQPSDKDTKSAANSSGWTLSISRSITAVVESCSQGANVSYAAPVLFEYSNPWMSGLTLPVGRCHDSAFSNGYRIANTPLLQILTRKVAQSILQASSSRTRTYRNPKTIVALSSLLIHRQTRV